MAADFGDAVLEFANRKYQRGLQEADAGWQNEQRDRQRKQWGEQDRVAAGTKAADEAFANAMEKLDTESPPAPRSLADSASPAPMQPQQPAAQPAQPQQGPGLAGAQQAGVTATPVPAQGLVVAQSIPDQPGASAQAPTQASVGLASAVTQPPGGSSPTASPNAEPPMVRSQQRMTEERAIYEAIGARGKALREHGLNDQYMQNWAKRSELGVRLRNSEGERLDARYAQTGDPAVYLELDKYLDTGLDMLGHEQKQGADGKPVYTIKFRDNASGKEFSINKTGEQILADQQKLRNPEFALKVEHERQIKLISTNAKIAEQDNKGNNDRLTEGVKSKNERQLEEDRQKGRMSLSAADASNSIKVNRSKASGDGEVSPKDQLASIDSQRREIQDNRELLFREYQEALEDDTLDDDQKKVVRASYEKQVADLNAASTDLGRQRKILESKVSLNGDAPAKTKGLSSAKSASKAPGAKPGTKTPTISGW